MMSWILRGHLALATVWLVVALVRASREPVDAGALGRALTAAACAVLAWQLTAAAGHGVPVALAAGALVHVGAALVAVTTGPVSRRIGAVAACLALCVLAARLVVPF